MTFMSNTASLSSSQMSSSFGRWAKAIVALISKVSDAPLQTTGFDTLSEKYLRDIGLTPNDVSLGRKVELTEIARARSGNW